MVRLVREAAPLHDLGKIAIPDSILLKPGRLYRRGVRGRQDPRACSARGCSPARDSEVLEIAERIVRHHHERWDGARLPGRPRGRGHPASWRGSSAVADVFDVLVHERPYKDSWSVEAAAEEIRTGAGTQFDPAVVEVFDALGPAGWQSEAQPV